MRRLTLLVLAALALALPASAAPKAAKAAVKAMKTAPKATNLHIYPGFLKDIRLAFDRGHGASAKRFSGPLLGSRCLKLAGGQRFCGHFHVYYARYRSQEYAFADFWSAGTGTTDQPERFQRPVGGRWRDVGDSGDPPGCLVPAPVAVVWGFGKQTKYC